MKMERVAGIDSDVRRVTHVVNNEQSYLSDIAVYCHGAAAVCQHDLID